MNVFSAMYCVNEFITLEGTKMAREVLFGPEIEIITFVADGQDFDDKGGEGEMRRYTDIGQEVHQRCENYMIIHKTDYPTAMRCILNADEQLKEKYTGISTEIETYSDGYPAGKFTQAEISVEVDRRIKNLMRENSALSYPEAMIQVLQEDPELKQAYHGSYYKQVG
jgi:hypothetical protein